MPPERGGASDKVGRPAPASASPPRVPKHDAAPDYQPGPAGQAPAPRPKLTLGPDAAARRRAPPAGRARAATATAATASTEGRSAGRGRQTSARQDQGISIIAWPPAFRWTFAAWNAGPILPLARGIDAAILEAMPELAVPGGGGKKLLRLMLAQYTRQGPYKAALQAGAARIGLDGQPCDTVTPREAESAAARLAARSTSGGTP